MRRSGGGRGKGGHKHGPQQVQHNSGTHHEAKPAVSQPDMVQLTALTAAASSAASNMALAIDAVVKEAAVFFNSMPPSARVRRPAGVEGPREISEEVFRNYEKRIHTDACSAAEACAEVHQWAARERDSATKDAARSMQAAMAAGSVGSLAQRTATTVREVAQHCMLILEEAVQANAGPMAREAAKRCAEQALRSVEAAAIAEQHSTALQELLAPVLRIYEQERRAALANAAVSSNQASFRKDGQASWGNSPRTAIAASHWQTSAHSPEENGGGAASGQGRARWWDEVPALPRRTARAAGASTLPEAGNALERSLKAKAKDCALAAAETLQQQKIEPSPGQAEEDQMALAAIVEWRYGLSLALQCDEQSILSDLQVGQLALWRSTSGEVLPSELLEAMRQKGSGHADTLIAALQSATRQAPPEPAPSKDFALGSYAAQYVRPFHKKEVKDVPCDIDQAFDLLHWVPGSSSTTEVSSGPRGAGALSSATSTAAAAAATLLLASADGDHNGELDANGDKEEVWDIDNMTLHTLHEYSMKSRSKQRRVAAKGKAAGEETGAAAPEPAGDVGTEESEEAEVRQFLLEVFGECQPLNSDDDLGSSALPSAPASTSKTSVSRNKKKKQTRAAAASSPTPTPAAPATAPGGAVQAATAVAATSPNPSVLFSGPAKVNVSISAPPPPGSTSVQTSTMEPVHRLIEPKELLSAAMGRQAGDYDELEDAEVEGDLPTRESLMTLFLQRGFGIRPSPPGHRQQQRQAFTFHESMEHIAVQRREAYGVPPGLGGCSSIASMRHPTYRARTFHEASLERYSSLPTTPVQGTFIRTPTWTSASSGELAGVAFKDDSLYSPLYVQPGGVGPSAISGVGSMSMDHRPPTSQR
mmetsp:Transcript_144/g.385  ORF Transcript_144/g.385 Transcript_144/m.385 type:complete len:876 (-) Transcript_144:85-2712(-)